MSRKEKEARVRLISRIASGVFFLAVAIAIAAVWVGPTEVGNRLGGTAALLGVPAVVVAALAFMDLDIEYRR